MKKNYLVWSALIALSMSLSMRLQAQGTDGYGSGIKIPLDSSGQKYIRFINWHQFWVRNSENNPGTLVNGEPTNSQTDMALRRSRFLFMTQLNPRFMIMTHIGINNQTLVGGGAVGQAANTNNATLPDGKKPQIFVHEAVAEYKLYKEAVSIGGGLHYWNGVSRISNASTLNFMTLDAPIFNWSNIDATDQFARMMGVYVKGKIGPEGRIDYRFAVNNPFAISSSNSLTKFNNDSTMMAHNVQLATYRGYGPAKMAFQGYVQYQFWDKEPNTLPYMAGCWLGTKKVFNIGAGFFQNSDAMWAAKLNTSTGKADTVRQSQLIYAVDAFLDMPLNSVKKAEGAALTVYAAHFNFDMGSNYIRLIGISNPANAAATSGATFSSFGNQYPTVGTGSINYIQAGYLLPKFKNKNLGRLQIMGDMTMAKYDRIQSTMYIPNIGLNWYVAGHSAKITINYHKRPVVDYVDSAKKWDMLKQTDSKNEFVLQLQVYL